MYVPLWPVGVTAVLTFVFGVCCVGSKTDLGLSM